MVVPSSEKEPEGLSAADFTVVLESSGLDANANNGTALASSFREAMEGGEARGATGRAGCAQILLPPEVATRTPN